MAGPYGSLNLRCGHMLDLNHGIRSSPSPFYGPTNGYLSPSQIGCRLCDKVFMSTQALIDHIGSHVMDGAAYSSIRQQRTPSLLSPQPIHNFQPTHFPMVPSWREMHSSPFSAVPMPMRTAFNYPSLSLQGQGINPLTTSLSITSTLNSTPSLLDSRQPPAMASNMVPFLSRNNQPAPAASSNHQPPRPSGVGRKLVVEPPEDGTKPFLTQLEHKMNARAAEQMEIESHVVNSQGSESNALDLTLRL